ncbi:MAG: tetratricopeptide repeat protein [Myxococcota bacterium]
MDRSDAGSDVMQIAEGTSIDRYEVEYLLGEGGMARVYCVRHRRLDSRHALKVLTRATPYLTARLLKEGRAQGRLQHPHLLPVRDILTVQGKPALLMPLVLGPSLEALLRAGRLAEDEALALFRCLLDGLAFAHAQGVVHRDLKPANILLEVRHGQVHPLVADFGLVKMEEEGGHKTEVGHGFGTPAYAAPEQLRDASAATARADLFSLGVILAEMLTGSRPFAGEGIARILDAHRLPPRLGGVEGPLRSLLEALLQVAPEDRPVSCDAVLLRLPSATGDALSSPALLDAVRRAAERPWGAAGALTPTFDPLGPRHNLSTPRDRFVGRERELGQLRQHLQAGRRLVTVLGAGGIGKSRLSRELGWASREEWPGGVWFCELAEARTAEGIATVVAGALDVPLGKEPMTQLTDAILGRGRALFILDNFEQLAAFAAGTLGVWLDRAPEAFFVVTSRVPLRLRGEHVLTLDVLGDDDAVRLFVERARQVDDHFLGTDEVLTPATAGVVRELVALLDRLPLAIELAAARSRMLSPADMLSRMGQRFALLRSASTELPARQRTLQAALEWSWDLLEPQEQAVLAQCSVFEGGFTLHAADAVIDAAGERWAEEVLAELVDKSLLQSRDRRLSMLRSVQAFARDRLTSPAEVEARHGRTFARMGSPAAVEALHHVGGVERRWALLAERENLVAATRRAMAHGASELAGGCALAVAEVYEGWGPLPEGVALLEAVLGLPDLGPDQRVRLQHKLGWLLRIAGRIPQAELAVGAALALDQRENDGALQGRLLLDTAILHRDQGRMDEALQAFERALALASLAGHRRLQAHAWVNLGILHAQQSRPDLALRYYEQALALLRDVGDRNLEARALGNLANLHRDCARMDVALRLYTEAHAIFHEMGDRRNEGVSLGNMGGLHREQGRMDVASQHMEQAYAIAREIGDRRFEGLSLIHLGNLRQDQGSFEGALQHFEQALGIHRELGDRLFEGLVLNNIGSTYKDQARFDLALPAFEAALAIFREGGNRAYEGRVLNFLGMVHLEQGREAEALLHYGQALPIARASGDRKTEGAVLGNLGVLYGRQGRRDEALCHLDAALLIAREVGDPPQLALLLCHRATRELEDHRPEEARPFLRDAHAIALRLGSPPGSLLGRALAAADARLEQATAPKPSGH